MRNISDKNCRGNQNTLLFNLFFENPGFYEIMWKNVVESGWPEMTI